MQVGLISDIHGSFSALQRVWDALKQHNLTNGPILNAGDNVGYGDQPQECIDFLRAHANILTVQGNYDRHVARFPEREDEYRRKWARARPDKFSAIQRDSRRITADARDWLLALPRERELELGGISILLTHYSPVSKEGVGRWTHSFRLAQLAAKTSAQVVVCGHTHSAFAREANGTLFVNPGSVGRGWGSRPSYAILTLRPPSAPSAVCAQVTP